MRLTSIHSLFFAAFVALAATLASTARAAAGTTHYVDNVRACDGLSPCYTTIMEAVGAAAPSDVIEVFPGVYPEAVFFDTGKESILLRAHADVTETPPGTSVVRPPRALLPVIQGTITLKASGVQVSSFVLEGSVTNDSAFGALDAVIDRNVIMGGDFALQFFHCLSSRVTNNQVLSGRIKIGGDPAGCLLQGNVVHGGSLEIGDVDRNCSGNVVHGNVVHGGDIRFNTCRLRDNKIERNRVDGGSIIAAAVFASEGNLVRGNVVRGGGIRLSSVNTPLGDNTVESNFVSGSAGDGILLSSPYGGASVVKTNTSVLNVGCDINDTTPPGFTPNTWTDNRFVTKCGAADE